MVGEEVGGIEEKKNTYEKFKVVLERNMRIEKLEQLFEDRQNAKNFKKVAYPFLSIGFIIFVLVAIFENQNDFLLPVNLGLLGDFFGLFGTILAAYAVVLVMEDIRVNSQLVLINTYLRMEESELDRINTKKLAKIKQMKDDGFV